MAGATPDLVVPGPVVPDPGAGGASGEAGVPAGGEPSPDASGKLAPGAGSGLPSGAASKLASDIMSLLREGTRDLHEALEAELDWERRVATLAGYRDLLARWWGVHAAAEPGLAAAFAGSARDRAFHAPRRKVTLLARDLAHLGLDAAGIAALPLCQDLRAPAADPGGAARAAALGTLYVFEGSTLGGQLMARHLARLHGLTREAGAAFLAPYPPGEVGPMWRAFRERATAESAAGGATFDAAMLAAARRTFAAVRVWLTA